MKGFCFNAVLSTAMCFALLLSFNKLAEGTEMMVACIAGSGGVANTTCFWMKQTSCSAANDQCSKDPNRHPSTCKCHKDYGNGSGQGGSCGCGDVTF
jgi:hypothetical protein